MGGGQTTGGGHFGFIQEQGLHAHPALLSSTRARRIGITSAIIFLQNNFLWNRNSMKEFLICCFSLGILARYFQFLNNTHHEPS